MRPAELNINMPEYEGNSRVNDSFGMDAGTDGSFLAFGAITHLSESDFDMPEVESNLNNLNPINLNLNSSYGDWDQDNPMYDDSIKMSDDTKNAIEELSESITRRLFNPNTAPSPATITGNVPTNDDFDAQNNWSDTGDQSKKRSPPSSPPPQRPPKAQRRGQLPTCGDEYNSDENPSTQRIDFKTQIAPPKNQITRTTRTTRTTHTYSRRHK